MKELGEGSRDIIASMTGWDINPRALGIVPKEAKISLMKGFHFVTDGHYMCIPKGLDAERTAVLVDVVSFMLGKPAQAFNWDEGYFYPGPAVKDVPLSMAPADSQDAIKEFGRPEYEKLHRRTPRPSCRWKPTRWCSPSAAGTSRSARRRRSDPTPLPPAGEGRGEGACNPHHPRLDAATLTQPSPARGRGLGTPMTIHAASFRELRLDRLSRDFGALNALKDITLTVKQGEFIALLGPSGCGKSTTLNMHRRPAARHRRRHLAGRQAHRHAAAGTARLRHGVPELRPVPAHDRPQEHRLRPDDAGRAPRRDAQRRVDEAIALVRLQGQEAKLPGQLSGGQQQRVAIARAIVIEPPLVLMDEPLSNLDAKLRLEMRAEIRRIHTMLGATTIYVTHDQEEALSLADRIVVLKDGVIRQVGTPAELFARPDHLDVAAFMGFRNAVPGRVDVRGRRAGAPCRSVTRSSRPCCASHVPEGAGRHAGRPPGRPRLHPRRHRRPARNRRLHRVPRQRLHRVRPHGGRDRAGVHGAGGRRPRRPRCSCEADPARTLAFAPA